MNISTIIKRGLALSLLGGCLVLGQSAVAAGCLTAQPGTLLQKSAAHAAIIGQAAKTHGVDAELIRAVIAVESCFNSRAVSPAGAEGLMQLMPDTADRFGVSDSFNPKQNILAGSRYLKWLLARFNGNVQYALAGYNAGEGRVDQYNGIPPYRETQNYVRNVLSIYSKLAPGKSVYPSNTIANGGVYFPYKQLAKSDAQGSSAGRVSAVYVPPIPKPPEPLTAKPGRQGLEYMRSQAPELFKKQ